MREQINTKRLVLRGLEDRDATRFARYGSDVDVARMTGSFPHPFPLLSAEFKIAHLKALRRRGLAYPYAITLKGDDRFLGVADLFWHDGVQLWGLGYWIARPWWNGGYMTEACAALLAEADAKLGVDDRVAGVFTDNPGSARVLEKLGFERQGEPEPYFSMARLRKAPSQTFILRRSA